MSETNASRSPRATILSSVHLALDNRVFYRQARTLQRAGYDVTLIAIHDRDEVKEGIRIRGLSNVPRWQRPRQWWRLLRMALETDADVYQIHDPELLLVTPWLRRITGRPTIYDSHELYPEFVAVKDYIPRWLRGPLSRLTGFLEPRLASRESGLIFADDAIATTFGHIDRPKTTLFNFPERGFVDLAASNATEADRRSPLVLYLGGMERNRGTAVMIAAFALIHQRVPEARLLLVGHFMPPELEAEVRQNALERGLENAITITGRVPFEQIGFYLRQAAAGWIPWQAFPKNEQNIPTKLFEYMAYGLPVVASDLPSTRPFVRHGETGFLVEASDVSAHADAIASLLQDTEMARKMGRTGQRLVRERYTWDPMAERLLDLYQRVLDSDATKDSWPG